jgi:hypothetical protein
MTIWKWLKGFVLFAMLPAGVFIFEWMQDHLRRTHSSFFDFAWNGFLTYWPIAVGIVVVLLAVVMFNPRTEEISEYLTVAERDLNSLLRSWGGGLSEAKRKELADLIHDGRVLRLASVA